MKKGLSLPIELIIIIIVAIVVMIAIVMFFTLNMKKGGDSMDTQQKWSLACSALKMMGCHSIDVEGITVGADPESNIAGTPMVDICNNIVGNIDDMNCCRACCGEDGCPD